MNSIQRKKVEEEITKIDKMELAELQRYHRKLFDSKPVLAPVVFEWLKKACDSQIDYLYERCEHSAEVIMSELDLS